jgi:c-di-AMP phosphodiesterase-like protein
MGNNSKHIGLKANSGLYLFIIGIFIMICFYYNVGVGVIGTILFIYLIFHNWRTNRARDKRWKKYIEELSSNIDSAARYAILNLPVPLTLVDFDGKITWYNSKFSEIVSENDLIGNEIKEVVSDVDVDRLINGEDLGEIKIGDRVFNILSSITEMGEGKESRYILMLYWIDVTNYAHLKELYKDEITNVAIIQVDNYDDVMSETKEEKKPFVASEIESKINLWASRMNGIIKKYSTDKYLVVFKQRYLDNLEAKRFTILDDIREIDEGNKIPVTLSIGVGVSGKNLSQLEDHAYSALELALGRGGDQAVVRKQGNFEFYGGKTKAVEKRNRVKARLIAHGLRPIIDESSRVIIMGHKNPDMDAYGAAIGVYRAVINRGKEAYIVLNHINESITNIHDVFSDNDEYNFVTSYEAIDLLEKDALVVVVDTHRPSFTECPDLLTDETRIVVIDHHRMGTEFIENTVLKYLEPYASSTSELVTEILQYMESKMTIEKIEAEALLAGISVDTKNFTFKTGVRTFEAASLLRRHGADTTVVRQLFQDDLEMFISKSNIVSNAKNIGHSVALSVTHEAIPSLQLALAQGADELLNIRGITTSFAMGLGDDDVIYVSARSLGDVNVQLIVEKIGGGGHITMAGAQLTDMSLDEAANLVIGAINEYFEEGD